jgi:hypothetical protein
VIAARTAAFTPWAIGVAFIASLEKVQAWYKAAPLTKVRTVYWVGDAVSTEDPSRKGRPVPEPEQLKKAG